MTPRRLPLHPDTIALFSPSRPGTPPADAPLDWTRKTLALAMLMASLGLFWVLVVWPLAAPIVRGELAREFTPVLQAWAAWTSAP